MRRRSLTPQDREAWDRVRASARPLRAEAPALPVLAPPDRPAPPGRAGLAPPSPAGEGRWRGEPRPTAIAAPPPFRVGEAADPRRPHDLLPGIAERLGRAPVRMDAGTFARLGRGKVRPEARLDLHGMRADEAHGALTGFVLGSRAKGRRLVLVITGKGRGGPRGDDLFPMPLREGRLRYEVPRWLSLAPLAPAVLQVAPAHPRHGGEGALYVYLRR